MGEGKRREMGCFGEMGELKNCFEYEYKKISSSKFLSHFFSRSSSSSSLIRLFVRSLVRSFSVIFRNLEYLI